MCWSASPAWCWRLYWTVTRVPSCVAFKCNILLYPAKFASCTSCRWGKHIHNCIFLKTCSCFPPLTSCTSGWNYTPLYCENMKWKLFICTPGSMLAQSCSAVVGGYIELWRAPSAAAFKCNILPNLHHLDLLLLLLHCYALSRIDWCTLERAEKPHRG